METITQILKRTDTDKEIFHKYGKSYETIFSRFSRDAKLNILEIGTQKGGSLLAWKEYFPNATVYGVDIIDVVADKYRKNTVTRIISDIKEWKNDIEWDIVIDDGSHHLLDIAWVVTHYIVKRRTNGVLVIEDVRFPSLIFRVIENLLQEISLIFPIPPPPRLSGWIDVDYCDTSAPESPGSFIIALFKNPF